MGRGEPGSAEEAEKGQRGRDGGMNGGCCRSRRWLLRLSQPLSARFPSEMSPVPGTTSAVPGGLAVTAPGRHRPLSLPSFPRDRGVATGSSALVIFPTRTAAGCGFPEKLGRCLQGRL